MHLWVLGQALNSASPLQLLPAIILAVIISVYTSEIPYVHRFKRRGVKKTPSGQSLYGDIYRFSAAIMLLCYFCACSFIILFHLFVQ